MDTKYHFKMYRHFNVGAYKNPSSGPVKTYADTHSLSKYERKCEYKLI